MDAYHTLEVWLFATDGSCRHSEGGYAVVVRLPPEERSTLLIRRAYIPAPYTNTKAEIRALAEALIMIGDLLRQTPLAHVTVLSDSLFCIQVLHGAFSTVSNVAEVAILLNAWNSVREFIELAHVKGHAGEFHNCTADFHAGYAREHRLGRRETFEVSRPGRLLHGNSRWQRQIS